MVAQDFSEPSVQRLSFTLHIMYQHIQSFMIRICLTKWFMNLKFLSDLNLNISSKGLAGGDGE